MRLAILLIVTFLGHSCHLFAQTEIRIQNGCSFEGVLDDTDLYGFDPSDEADRIVAEIMALHSLPKNFVVKAANVSNAMASTDPTSGQRFILYNTSFLEKFKADANTRWAAYSVLAHEIGHHLSGHNFGETEPKMRKRMELEADRFAGGTLCLLGASLADAQAGLNTFALEGETSTHPSKVARLEAIASQWKTKNEWMRENGVKAKTPITLNWKLGQTQAQKNTKPASPPSDVLPRCAFCPEMVNVLGTEYLPDGRFKMGGDGSSYDGEKSISHGPIHPVAVQTFEIGKYEVTNQEFCAFLNGISPEISINGSEISWNGSLINVLENIQYDNGNVSNGEFTVTKGYERHPVTWITWEGAGAYANWLNTKLSPNGDQGYYRLPSESEWEYASRGGALSKGTRYSGGNSARDVANFRNGYEDEKYGILPVGKKRSNELGVYDMGGNVWEWCDDCLNTSYAGHPRDGSAWQDGDCDSHILRGGAFHNFDSYLNVEHRNARASDIKEYDYERNYDSIGFRLARSK